MRKIKIELTNELFKNKLKSYIIDHLITDNKIIFSNENDFDLIITDNLKCAFENKLLIKLDSEQLKDNEIFKYSSGDIYINKIEKLLKNNGCKETTFISFITDHHMILKERMINKMLKNLNNKGYKILLMSLLTFNQNTLFKNELSNLIFNYTPDIALKKYVQKDKKLNVDYLIGLNHINDFFEFKAFGKLLTTIGKNNYDYVLINHNNILDENSILSLDYSRDIFFISKNNTNYEKMLRFLENNTIDTDKCKYLNDTTFKALYKVVDQQWN